MLKRFKEGSLSAKAQVKFEDLPRLLKFIKKQIAVTKRRNELKGIKQKDEKATSGQNSDNEQH